MLQNKYDDLINEMRESHEASMRLKYFLANPVPEVHFGSKGEEFSARTFRFGCKLLNCKLTCQSAADVVEVVYNELFPHYKDRLPSREQFEVWRRQLYCWCRWAILDTLQNKCEFAHLCDDATTKGKSVASRKIQMHLTGGVGVLKAEYGGGVFTFQAGLHIITDGRAATEGDATVQALSIEAGEYSRKLELSKVVSKTTDSAPTAMASSQFVADAKQVAAEMTEGDKSSLSALQAEIATRPLKKRRCQNHVYSFLCGHFIGQRTTEPSPVGDNVEKEKTSHGQVEHRVQGKFMATEILSWHLSIAAGRAIVRGALTTHDTSTHTFTLLRWAWVKMAPHFNLCDRNPVSYFSRPCVGKTTLSMPIDLFLSRP